MGQVSVSSSIGSIMIRVIINYFSFFLYSVWLFDWCLDWVEQVCETVEKPVTITKLVYVCSTTSELQCNTQSEEKCSVVAEKQCNSVPEKECVNVKGVQKCWDEARESCENVPKKVCQEEPTTKCSNKAVLYTDYEAEEVCKTEPPHVCSLVPVRKWKDLKEPVASLVPTNKYDNKQRKVCKQVQRCKQCHVEEREVCKRLPIEDCKDVSKNVPVPKTCYKSEQKCKTVTEKQCKRISRQ